jgi:hypothetical protein
LDNMVIAVGSIMLSPPDVGELEQQYVLQAMKSGWVTPAGPDQTAFEEEVAVRVGVSHAVGLSSSTAALHLAMVFWEVGPGDVVPLSTFTFAATVNADVRQEAVNALKARGASVTLIAPVDKLGKYADDAISQVIVSTAKRLASDAAELRSKEVGGGEVSSFGLSSLLPSIGPRHLVESHSDCAHGR